MARTKKTNSETNRKRKPSDVKSAKSKPRKEIPKEKIKIINEIKGIVFIALGIFMGFAFLTETTGVMGTFLRTLFYGLLGPSAAISCVFVIITGFFSFMDKVSEKHTLKYVMLGLLVLVTSVIVAQAFGQTQFVGGNLVDVVASLWNDGVDGTGGGFIGGGLCGILNLIVGSVGTWVIAIAAEIIFFIILMGTSVKNMFDKVVTEVKKRRPDEDAEDEFELPEHSEQSDAVKEKLRKRRKGKFFDKYFGDEDVVEDEPEKPKRFEFKEDDERFSDIMKINREFDDTDDDLPFDIDNIKTGVISELPDENGNYEKPVENEEGTDYEPPSEAKLEDKLDILTQRAVDAGVPLDRAVDAGRRMVLDEAEENTIDVEINRNISEEKKKPKVVRYRLPKLDLLEEAKPQTKNRDEIKAELEEKANRLLDTLRSFKVDAEIIDITQGPSVTRFELQPGPGVKVSKITNLADDIALSLAASGVRIEPVPGKSAIGIELPNKKATPVPIREVLSSEKFRKFKSKTAVALGKDISGQCVVADIADFPHGLIAGATGSGKSVCINALIMSILFKARPDEVKMIMVDPKMVELGYYNGIPHLLIPVVTDPKHAAGALNWAVGEMKNRYKLLNENKVRNLEGYNKLMDEIGEPDGKLPEIVIIIDELADLMMAAKNEVENAINSLAALARAAGMYLIIATQRPSVNVVTGVIKNNIPTRIAFAVTSYVDSRTIIDTTGAEKLLGKGDMLYCPRGAAKPLRVQGNFVSDDERDAVIEYIKSQYEAEYDSEIIENIEREREQVNSNTELSDDDDGSDGQRDKMFYEAVELVLENGQASVAMFQRKFKMGYQRAAKLIDQMEKYKIIGPYEGTKPRQVLISRREFEEMRMNNPD